MDEVLTQDLPLRSCRYCRKRFRPKKEQQKDTARFCCESHRVEFHSTGSMEFQKLMNKLVKELTKQIQETAISRVYFAKMKEMREEIEAAVESSVRRKLATIELELTKE